MGRRCQAGCCKWFWRTSLDHRDAWLHWLECQPDWRRNRIAGDSPSLAEHSYADPALRPFREDLWNRRTDRRRGLHDLVAARPWLEVPDEKIGFVPGLQVEP